MSWKYILKEEEPDEEMLRKPRRKRGRRCYVLGCRNKVVSAGPDSCKEHMFDDGDMP
tara:strand:+ start:634 stop:804 length:171 start_codon:yes stop_codon:yes gene_type:complete